MNLSNSDLVIETEKPRGNGPDLVVASEEARFAVPGVKIGLFCTTPMVPVSRAVGRKRAMEMLLTGEPISAQTAQAWGLVNRLASPDELDAAVADLVASITRYSPAVIGVGKDGPPSMLACSLDCTWLQRVRLGMVHSA